MAMQLEIIRAAEFVRADTHGELDLAASKNAFKLIANACQLRGIQNAVMDLREFHPGPIPALTCGDLIDLINTFSEVGFTRNLRLAILYASDPHKRGQMFEFLSDLRGWNVKTFSEFEAAVMWFSERTNLPEPSQPGELLIPIPIQFNPPAA